jgi:aminoglycoside phosphotransferase (APT) family kinase protein
MPEIVPDLEDVRRVLRAGGREDLALREIRLMDHGWDYWAFLAGETVIRLPKSGDDTEKLRVEARLTRLLGPRLPLPIPLLEAHSTPAGVTFTTHRLVEGVPLRSLQRPPAADFGASLGRFLSVLHSTPADEAAAAGVLLQDGPVTRAGRIERWQKLARTAFPLLGCEARAYAERVFESHINDPSAFQFEPCLAHMDIDDRNLIVDPSTGALAGVVDFGDAQISTPAMDYVWAHRRGLEQYGISAQLPFLYAEGGFDPALVERICDYTEVWWCLEGIQHAVEIGDEDFLAEDIRELNALVPRGIRC